MAKKGNQPKKAYICYPFFTDFAGSYMRFEAVIHECIRKNWVPVISASYLSRGQITEGAMLLCAYHLIAVSDIVVLCYDEHMTSLMMKEAHFASAIHKPITRLQLPAVDDGEELGFQEDER